MKTKLNTLLLTLLAVFGLGAIASYSFESTQPDRYAADDACTEDDGNDDEGGSQSDSMPLSLPAKKG